MNRMRMRDLRQALNEVGNTPSGDTQSEQYFSKLQTLAEQLCEAVEQQQRKFNAFVDELNVRFEASDKNFATVS